MTSERTQHLRPTALTLWEPPWLTLRLELDCLAPVKRFRKQLACTWRLSVILILVFHFYDLTPLVDLEFCICRLQSATCVHLLHWSKFELLLSLKHRLNYYVNWSNGPSNSKERLSLVKKPCFLVTNLKTEENKWTWIWFSFQRWAHGNERKLDGVISFRLWCKIYETRKVFRCYSGFCCFLFA